MLKCETQITFMCRLFVYGWGMSTAGMESCMCVIDISLDVIVKAWRIAAKYETFIRNNIHTHTRYL